MLRNFAFCKCSLILLSAGYQTVPSSHLAHLVHLAQQACPSPYTLPWLLPIIHNTVCISFGTQNPQLVRSTCAQAKGKLIINDTSADSTSTSWHNLLSMADVKTLLVLLAGSLNSRHWMMACLDFWLPSLLS